jgi:hypothetical protein
MKSGRNSPLGSRTGCYSNELKKIMKKYLLLAAASLSLVNLSLADTTATLTIQGTVNNVTSIVIAPQNNYNDLNVSTGETDKVVGVATERCNSRLGYTVALSSLNAGTGTQAFLKAITAGNTDVINYSLKYNGTIVPLVAGSAVVTDVSSRTPNAGLDKNISVTVAGAQWSNTDTYRDTLTVEITAK